MENQDVFSYITTQETNFGTARVPLTSSKDWNFKEHVERCTAVSGGYFFQGKNDGMRPYDDVVTPVINVSFRSEGFDVKDIIPYVDDISQSYKSFLIKKRHPQWARQNELDTFIDDVVESSIIYDLVLIKNVNNVKPEVIDLKTIAFCDQTDVMAGPICIKHQYTPAELTEYRGKWDDEAIDMAIKLSVEEIEVSIAGGQKVKTPGKYISVYELRGNLPETWLKEGGDLYKYVPQMHLVAFYNDNEGNKQGLTLYSGKDKPLARNFKALKIDRIRSRGRACGRSIVETLFEPQVWNNYSAIKLKALMDSALNVLVTNSDEIANQKLTELKPNTILKQERDSTTTLLSTPLQNVPVFTNHQAKMANDARILGSASEGSLGMNPTSGTPFALENLVVQQGQGMHEFRQGKIATFFADSLYRDWILKYLVDDMNAGLKFSEELTLEELEEIGTIITDNAIEKKIKESILKTGKIPTDEERDLMKEVYKEQWMKQGNRRFFETLKGELDSIPIAVKINIKGKQKDMARQADAFTKVIQFVLGNMQAIQQTPGIVKGINEVLENSGLSPLDFRQVLTAQNTQTPQSPPSSGQLTNPAVGAGKELALA